MAKSFSSINELSDRIQEMSDLQSTCVLIPYSVFNVDFSLSWEATQENLKKLGYYFSRVKDTETNIISVVVTKSEKALIRFKAGRGDYVELKEIFK